MFRELSKTYAFWAFLCSVCWLLWMFLTEPKPYSILDCFEFGLFTVLSLFSLCFIIYEIVKYKRGK